MKMKEYDQEIVDAAIDYSKIIVNGKERVFRCEIDAFKAGAAWMYDRMMKEGEQKGMPRQKTAYINGLGVETR